MFRKLTCLLIISIVSLTGFAGEITGKWKANVETPNEIITNIFEFRRNRGTLEGTFRNNYIPNPIPLHAVEVNGDDVSFRLRIMSGVSGYRGKMEDNNMMLNVKVIEGSPPGPKEYDLTLTHED